MHAVIDQGVVAGAVAGPSADAVAGQGSAAKHLRAETRAGGGIASRFFRSRQEGVGTGGAENDIRQQVIEDQGVQGDPGNRAR